MNGKPRIGLTMRLEQATGRFYLRRDYCEALENFGAIPLYIGLIPKKEYIRECVEKLDGILLPGSDSDVNPLKYNEEPIPRLGNIVPEKDATDLLVLEVAEEFNIPMKHQQGSPINKHSHSLVIEEKGFLHDISKKASENDKVFVNSSHHQSVKTVGENLTVTARAKDDVIECIEDIRPNRFTVGVQWHPELSWKEDKISAELFKVFVEHCR